MGLQSTLSNMCATLHAVHNFSHTDAPQPYRVIVNDGMQRLRLGSEFDMHLVWTGLTPPAQISLDFHERVIGVYSSNPTFRITGDVIDCGFGADDFLGATWFRMVNIALRTFDGKVKALAWAKVMHRDTNSDSVGFFVPPFSEFYHFM